ncbi:MAG: hypothetical protein HY812_15640 [Planctomycetes bacterium]|nr:hypothetical protein [Planctomycetota bacterium]
MTRPEAHCAEGARVSYDWDETLAEWYVNDARGLEHGYTVHARPEGAGVLLAFELAVRGGLEPAISSDGRDVQFASAGGGAVLTYAGLSVVDADGRPLPAEFTRTERGLRLTIDDAGARYPLTIDPYAQQAYLKASNSGNLSFFGYSVCRSGDTVVVGAYRRLAWTGAAYVFVRSGTTWSQQACLQASNTEPDEFGKSVSISGDTLVVGAPYEDSAATGVNGNEADNSTYESGAAYVFVRTGATWSQQAYLKASNTGANDHFGMSASVSGDTVVIGAYGEDSAATGVNGNQADSSAPYAGAAYVFTRSGATWSQQAYLKASNTEAGDFFGGAVSVSGDTVVAGANEDSAATGVNGNQADNNAPISGAAYVFVRTGSTWSQQAYLKASNTEANDWFGYSVSVSGDTVVVGAPCEGSSATGVNGNQADNSAPWAGAAYVFTRSGATWSQQAYLKASNTGAKDHFGMSASVSGDTVVVGAPGEDSSATGVNGNQADNSADNAGAAHVFMRTASTWSQQAYLKASNTDFGDEFGNSVSVSGDTVVVGAEYEDSAATGVNGYQADNSAVDAGAAYVFDVCSSTAVATSYGAGKPGTAGVPVLSSTNLPKIGTTADLTISNGLAGAAPVLLLAGFAPAAMPFDGGTLLVTPAFVVGLPPLGAGGSLVLPVPITPWADGVHVYFQAMFFDPGATGYYQSAQTNGLDWTVGG